MAKQMAAHAQLLQTVRYILLACRAALIGSLCVAVAREHVRRADGLRAKVTK
jgi:hypothetical protein